jgi:hypothetical protein
MLKGVADFLSGKKPLHLKFLNFDNSNSGVKNSTKTKTTTQTQSTVTNNYNGPVTIVQINGPIDEAVRKDLKPLLDTYEKKEALFIADVPKKLLSDVTAHEQDSLVRGLLRFFKPKLTSRDFQLLRTGLYVKYLRESDRKEESVRLWKQITDSYSPREKTIINLASAGYYHTYFRPLYKQLLRGPDTQKKFDKEYEKALDDTTFAIFVHGQMSVDDIVAKVTEKAIKNIRYGVKIETISLHATGATCIATVRQAMNLLKPTFPSMKATPGSRGLAIITVSIDYRNNSLTDEDLQAQL